MILSLKELEVKYPKLRIKNVKTCIGTHFMYDDIRDDFIDSDNSIYIKSIPFIV